MQEQLEWECSCHCLNHDRREDTHTFLLPKNSNCISLEPWECNSPSASRSYSSKFAVTRSQIAPVGQVSGCLSGLLSGATAGCLKELEKPMHYTSMERFAYEENIFTHLTSQKVPLLDRLLTSKLQVIFYNLISFYIHLFLAGWVFHKLL